ncbi:hypothetical protein AZF37_01905 [endosymbiont 'TC1' of Trimyema compressum]|uniref:selenium cofactor biosynthesis protein YqeC n=1 Tax=endosymbiont 'TC1' of Trimyema compressum TaxID=243899 RepID=UPI0007F05E93|nr:selenium cofactor biosynthesis protein YqeC [endosymbiont 'TC1' of Trimyema compressum]AMP20096.1 hypothetical protein AZF37_01905 [endosymbiont 'TC1' of Trimyema compressum]
MDFKSFVKDSFKGGHLYTFVGGGGKSSSIWAIGNCLREIGYKVRISTTTKVDLKEFSNYETCFIESESAMQKAILDVREGLLLVKGVWQEKGKYFGVENSFFDAATIPLDTVVLVEGDGAKRKPFKIPKSHEPVLPKNSATLFVVIGASIINEEITGQNCYNIDRVLELLGDREKIFSIDNTRYLIETGWLSREASIPTVFLFNQCDLEGKATAAREIVEALWLKHNVAGVAFSVQEKEVFFKTGSHIIAIILAAGKSSRMGTVKCLLDYKGKTFLERAIELYGNYCQDIVIPVGYHSQQIKDKIKGFGFEFFDSKIYEEGMGGTLREAILNLNYCDFFFVTLCDLPLVQKETLRKLLKVASENQKAVVPVYHGKKGHPVLFPRKMRADFAKLKGDLGAKKTLTANNTIFVNVEDEGVITDIDTPEAYYQLGGEND